jgi:hypothetical protein
MDLTAFIKERQRRERLMTRFLDLLEQEEEEAPAPSYYLSRSSNSWRIAGGTYHSSHQIYLDRVSGDLRDRGWGLSQSGRGRRWSLQSIDRFFILLIYLTSGFTFDAIAENVRLTRSCTFRIVTSSLTPVTDGLGSLIPANAADVRCTKVFDHSPHVFVIVDASPVFINPPVFNQQQFYSGKFKRHCVKVQALVAADGQCVHLSEPFRGSLHDKAIFDHPVSRNSSSHGKRGGWKSFG